MWVRFPFRSPNCGSNPLFRCLTHAARIIHHVGNGRSGYTCRLRYVLYGDSTRLLRHAYRHDQRGISAGKFMSRRIRRQVCATEMRSKNVICHAQPSAFIPRGVCPSANWNMLEPPQPTNSASAAALMLRTRIFANERGVIFIKNKSAARFVIAAEPKYIQHHREHSRNDCYCVL